MALVELRISGLAVLDGVRLAPGPQLTALTGETGSGKSLCVTGLRLALGARVDGDPVAAGAERATVAAVFDEVPAAARALLEAHGIADDDLLTLSRELPAGGRGACRINGALVAQSVLRAVGETLVEVTAQGESGRLGRPAWQRALLDSTGGPALAAARAATASAALQLRAAEQRLDEARAAAATGGAALATARMLIADLEPLDLRTGEEEALEAEQRRLVHAVALREVLEGLHGAAAGDDAAPGAAARGAADTLATAVAAAGRVAGVDAEVDSLVAAATDLVERLRDLGSEARRGAAAIDVDGARLAAVDERLRVLDRVRRRHGSIEAALVELAAARAVVDAGAGADLARLEVCATEAGRALAAAAVALSALRATAARRLEAEVLPRLRALRLPHARFRVVLGRRPDPAGVLIDGETVACGIEGVDQVEMRFTAAADGVPLPLGEGVSGGELSRLALALRAVGGGEDDAPTLVLDEVDTGLGGETAARVGDALAAAAAHRQLLVVTHRAEIAARADTHLVVRRPGPGEGTAAVVALGGERRDGEIARLLSGEATAAAVARARELLAEGRRTAAAGDRPARSMAPR